MGAIDVGELVEMTWLWSTVAIAAIAGFLLVKLLRGSLSQPKDIEPLLAQLQPVNPKSLAQLTSVEDDLLLKRSVPPARYRQLRKKRLLALSLYCRAALKNCAILQSYGQVLQRSIDFETRQFGITLASAALHLRPQLFRAIALAQIGAYSPHFRFEPAGLSGAYDKIAKNLLTTSRSESGEIKAVLARAFSEV